jgi:transposase
MRQNQRELPILHPNAAGIDVGSTFHMVAVGAGTDTDPVRTFKSFTADLHALADWFKEAGVTTVAMESTGVYWIPVYEILEARGFEVILVNARFAKNVPGRKTDVSDAQWLQQLHSFGLLRSSFRPREALVRLRTYLRHRAAEGDEADECTIGACRDRRDRRDRAATRPALSQFTSYHRAGADWPLPA